MGLDAPGSASASQGLAAASPDRSDQLPVQQPPGGAPDRARGAVEAGALRAALLGAGLSGAEATQVVQALSSAPAATDGASAPLAQKVKGDTTFEKQWQALGRQPAAAAGVWEEAVRQMQRDLLSRAGLPSSARVMESAHPHSEKRHHLREEVSFPGAAQIHVRLASSSSTADDRARFRVFAGGLRMSAAGPGARVLVPTPVEGQWVSGTVVDRLANGQLNLRLDRRPEPAVGSTAAPPPGAAVAVEDLPRYAAVCAGGAREDCFAVCSDAPKVVTVRYGSGTGGRDRRKPSIGHELAPLVLDRSMPFQPIRVSGFLNGGPAQEQGVQPGWFLDIVATMRGPSRDFFARLLEGLGGVSIPRDSDLDVGVPQFSATCDQCDVELHVGEDWHHKRDSLDDLSKLYFEQLVPESERHLWICVDSADKLGAQACQYAHRPSMTDQEIDRLLDASFANLNDLVGRLNGTLLEWAHMTLVFTNSTSQTPMRLLPHAVVTIPKGVTVGEEIRELDLSDDSFPGGHREGVAVANGAAAARSNGDVGPTSRAGPAARQRSRDADGRRVSTTSTVFSDEPSFQAPTAAAFDAAETAVRLTSVREGGLAYQAGVRSGWALDIVKTRELNPEKLGHLSWETLPTDKFDALMALSEVALAFVHPAPGGTCEFEGFGPRGSGRWGNVEVPGDAAVLHFSADAGSGGSPSDRWGVWALAAPGPLSLSQAALDELAARWVASTSLAAGVGEDSESDWSGERLRSLCEARGWDFDWVTEGGLCVPRATGVLDGANGRRSVSGNRWAMNGRRRAEAEGNGNNERARTLEPGERATVSLTLKVDQESGLELDLQEETPMISEVLLIGAAFEWNAAKLSPAVQVHQRILEVNGKVDIADMLGVVKSASSDVGLKLTLMRPREELVTIPNPERRLLGVSWAFEENGRTLLVKEVGSGPVLAFNRAKPELAIRKHDRISSVDGVQGLSRDLLRATLDAARSKDSVALVVLRYD